MNRMEIEDLILTVKNEDSKTLLCWEGESNERNPEERLTQHLDKIIENVKGELVIKFNDLKFMNSATVFPVISFLTKLNRNKINTEIHYDKESSWQKASFKAMESLSYLWKHIKFISD